MKKKRYCSPAIEAFVVQSQGVFAGSPTGLSVDGTIDSTIKKSDEEGDGSDAASRGRIQGTTGFDSSLFDEQ